MRRSLATCSLAAGLLATAGCMGFDGFPRLRGLFNGNDCCPPAMAHDVEGPILEPGEVLVGPSAVGPPTMVQPPAPEQLAPQPRLVPQPLPAPEAEPTPYKPTKKGK